MAITDSVANFVDRLRADIAFQNYWNSQAALNNLQNEPTSDPYVVRRIQEETQAQRDAALHYAQMIKQQMQRKGKEPTISAKTIEELMGERGGSPLRPVVREAPNMSKGDYSYGMTPEEEKKYAFASPPRVVSRKQFKTEEEYQAWLASRPKTDEEMLKTPKSEAGATVYGEGAPEAQTAPAKPEADFVQAANRGGQRALDVSDMGFGDKQRKPAWKVLQELEATAHPLDAQDFRYKLEQQDLDKNKRRLFAQAQQIAATEGIEAAERFQNFHLKQIEAMAKTKPIEESEGFKMAQAYINNNETRKTIDLLRTFADELTRSQKMLKQGADRGEVTRFLSANVPKIINFMSTMSTDALQPAEVARIAPELQSYASSGLNFNQWIDIAANRGIFNAAFKSPEDFIKKANMIYDAAAKSVNMKFDDVKRIAGESAYSKMGLEGFKFPMRSIDPGKLPTRQGMLQTGAAATTVAPAGAVKKSVSLQSVYPQ